MSNSLRDALAKKFVQALNEDQLPWRQMWASQRAYNASTGKDYHGINAMWLAVQAGEHGYTDPRWCTYNQANAHGWSIKKGEKGTKVEFWSQYDTKTRQTLTQAEADKIISEDPEREKDMYMMAKRYTVFNAEQIRGIPPLEKQETVDMVEVAAQRDTLLRNMGLSLREGGNEAYYEPASDTITMPASHTFQSEYGYMSTLLHEAGHATGHESRLNRDLSGGFGSEQYAKEELRAEIASAFTAQALGMHGNDDEPAMQNYMTNHKAYVQSWSKAIKDAPHELFLAIKDAEKISDYLIEKGEFQRVQRAKTALSPENEQKVIAGLEKEFVPEEQRSLYDSLLERINQDNPQLTPIEKSCVAMSILPDEDIITVDRETMAGELYELHYIDDQRDYTELAQFFDCEAIVREAREEFENEQRDAALYVEEGQELDERSFEEYMEDEYRVSAYYGTTEERAVALLNARATNIESHFQKDEYLMANVDGRVVFGGELLLNQQTNQVFAVPNISYEWADPYLARADELRKEAEGSWRKPDPEPSFQEQLRMGAEQYTADQVQQIHAKTQEPRKH